MPGKSQKQKYGEFRVFVEWRRRGKWAIRPEFVPSLAAWLLMIGKRYERMAAGMRDRLALGTVPGLKESADVLDICCRNIQLLLNALPEHFDNDDWQASVAEICQLMNIRPSSAPLEEVPAGQFEHLIQEPVPSDGESTRDSDVQLRTGAGASGAQLPELDGGARGGGADAGSVPPLQTAVRGDDPVERDDGGAPRDRGKRSRKKHDRKRRGR